MQEQSQAGPQIEKNIVPFDEKPIGVNLKANQMSEYPLDYNLDNMNIQQKKQLLPLQKRVHSKVWKIRKQAFQQLLNQVNQNSVAYHQYLKDSVTFITDSHPICQQKALKILLKYLQGTTLPIDDPKPIIKAIIQKCLVVQKGQTTSLSTQILFWMMDHYQQYLLNEINENMLNKNPKIVSSVLTFMQKLINNYGIKKLQLQQFGKNFTLLSSSVRPTSKLQLLNLFKQIYRWIGDNVFNYSMHHQIKDELTKYIKSYIKQPMIIKRGLNEDQIKSKKPIIQLINTQQNTQPQDILLLFDSKWVNKILLQKKWKNNKNQLDTFIQQTNHKNIVNRDISHYNILFNKLLTENNINLLQCGFKIIQNLCKGLKQHFSHQCKTIKSLVFSKLKDTKAMIIDEARQTLQIMMNCLTIDDLFQDIKKGLIDKAPNMKFQTLYYIQKMIQKKDRKMANTFKNLTFLIVDLNQDGSNQVRAKALEVLCKLKGAYGLNFFGDKLKKIQQKKLQTIQNYSDPNSDNKIEEQPGYDNSTSYSMNYQKKKPKPSEPQQKMTQSQQSQPNSMKNSMINQPVPKNSSFLNHSQLESMSETIRVTAFQNLLQKPPQLIYTQLIQGFKNKIPMTRQNNPTILKLILNLVKKSVHNTLNIQHLDYLMYHDWKKCKPLLVQFIQNNKLSLPSLQYIKNIGLLNQTNPQIKKSQGNQKHQDNLINPNNQSSQSPYYNTNNTNSLKLFYSSIQGLIPKMSNPDPNVRLTAADSALDILKTIPIGALLQSSVQPSPTINQSVSQLFNILKYRIQDSNEQISNKYINLITQMLAKGFLTKYRTQGRLIMSILLQKLTNPNLTNLQSFIRQMVANHSTILWQFLVTQLVKQSMCSIIINTIRMNNESFFQNADQKSYILPLLTCISQDIQTKKCSQLLDQIVEINGEQVLERVAKQNKLTGFHIQNYLKKWNIHLNNIQNSLLQKNKNFITTFNPGNVPFIHSKIQRINSEQQNPWPLTPSPIHILKMMSQMIAMGQPFQTLASPTTLSDNQLSIISNLKSDIIEDYSDLFTKWIFWRIHIEFQPKNLECIFNFILKIINMKFQLHEQQIVTLLGSLIGCLTIHKSQYLKQISKINSSLNQHPLYKQRTFRFWINSFNDPSAPVDQILNLFVNSCPDMIPSQMVTLARYPAVAKNKQFTDYLLKNYTEKLLTVYGFKLQNFNNSQQKQIISQSLSMQSLTEGEKKYFIQLFQKYPSNQLVDKLIQQTGGIPHQYVMQTHLKIMHSIIPPYLHRQLSFINVYNYFKHVQKAITVANCSPYLLNLVKILAFFLIDLDQMKLQNYTQMLKTINKLLLILLQISQPKNLLEVLFVILKHQLTTNGNVKLTLLLPKCIAKVIKNPIFKSQNQQNLLSTESISFICKQYIEIICIQNLPSDHSIIRAIKTSLNQMMLIFPNTITCLQNILNYNNDNISQKGLIFIKQLIQQKIKQNNQLQLIKKNQTVSIYINDQNSYTQPKDIKNAVGIIKSLKPACGQKKTVQQMDQ